MKDNSWEELPFIALDETITIEAGDLPIEDFVIDDYVLTRTGTFRYAENKAQTAIVPVIDGKSTITLSADPYALLSSQSNDYKPGNTIRCFVIRSNMEVSSLAFAFILRTDAYNLQLEKE